MGIVKVLTVLLPYRYCLSIRALTVFLSVLFVIYIYNIYIYIYIHTYIHTPMYEIYISMID